MADDRERNVVIGVFSEKSKLQQAIAKDETVGATIEQVADEAVVVTKQLDGALTISRSDHSIGRSLAALIAKLMIAVPLGFYGVLAVSKAGVEITAASAAAMNRPRLATPMSWSWWIRCNPVGRL